MNAIPGARADEDDDLLDPPENGGGEQQEQEEDDDAAIEARARRGGWVPEEEWDEERAQREGRTKPTSFMTARKWVERMDRDNRMLRQQNRRLDGELATTKAEVAKQAAAVDNLSKLVDDLLKTQKVLGDRAYAKARADIERKMEQAVEEANPEAFKEAKAGLEKLDEERVQVPERQSPADPPPPPGKPQVDPYVETWMQENRWYGKDPVARGAATAIHGELLKSNPDWTIEQNLAEVRTQIEARFPEHFENPRRREAGRVNPPSGDRGQRQRQTTFDDLTPEQKATYERQARHFKAKGTEYTKAQFLEDQLLG